MTMPRKNTASASITTLCTPPTLGSGVMMSVGKHDLSRAKVESMLLGCDDCWAQTGKGDDSMFQ